ncbi:MAG TPA: vanadium-dependent haloperoxidase [Kofleriaceae bacterium]|nr:vanadium-dependent haloperoxidase [Kofleriaceae bacterium]
MGLSRLTLATLTGITLLNGCVDEQEAREAEVSSDLLGGSAAETVTAWASIAADAILRPDEASTALRSPGPSAMLMAQVQLAVYDAIAVIDGTYEPFSYPDGLHLLSDRRAAAATAAYRILRTRVPGRAAHLDAQYEATMDEIPFGLFKAFGVALGEDVAEHYLALRANDNIDNTTAWVQPTPGPGVFEPVAPSPPADYKMVFVQPFTFSIAQSSSFFPPPPPALTSPEYAAAWTEARDLGRSTSAVRTEAQKQLALWAAEHPFRWTARNLIDLAVAKDLGAMDAARFFALTFTSVADTLQTGMSAKYHYNFWRPFHAIPRADTDGNVATAGDPTWTPLLNVNHPEYPAGHGFVGAGSMVEAVRAFFDTDAVSWTLTTVGVAGLTETSRSYTSLDALAADVMEARILAGLHYRFSMEAGRAQGEAVVDHIQARFFHRD